MGRKNKYSKLADLFELACESRHFSDYSKVIKLCKEDPEINSDWLLNYYAGLSYYFIENDDDEVKHGLLLESISFFNRAHELNVDDLMTKVYLAYSNYDAGRFVTSNKMFDYILQHNHKEFYNLNIEWRVIDCLELLATGQLKLGHINKYIAVAENWQKHFAVYLNTIDETIPKEMIITVSSFLKSHGEALNEERFLKFKMISAFLIVIIENRDNLKVVYKEELKNLKNWSNHNHDLPILKISY